MRDKAGEDAVAGAVAGAIGGLLALDARRHDHVEPLGESLPTMAGALAAS